MGLTADIQVALSAAMKGALADVVSTFTLTRSIQGAYNSSTDAYETTDTVYPGEGVFGAFGSAELARLNIKPGDEKLVVNAVDLAVSPEVDESIVLSDGSSRDIVAREIVPGGASAAIIYLLQVRNRAGQ